jgi:hypothetical protein
MRYWLKLVISANFPFHLKIPAFIIITMKRTLMVSVAVLMALPLIAAAAMRLDVNLMSCRELLCENATDVFLVGAGAYIDYNSSVRGISYWAQLTFPDGTKYQITFPNRITSNVTGNYTVEITAWKEGYDEFTGTKVVQFVDKLPESSPQNTQNPPVLDWQKFLLFVVAAVMTVLVVRRIYSRRKRPVGKKAEAKPGKGKIIKKR